MSRICNDWFIRVGDGANFESAYKYNVWGINTKNSVVKGAFNLECKNKRIRKCERIHKDDRIHKGDRLWFVTNNSKKCGKGRVIACAIYVSLRGFVNSPGELTNIELGWTDKYVECQLIQYTNLYLLHGCGLYVENLPMGSCINNQRKNDKPYMEDAEEKYKYLSMFHAAMKMN